MASAMESDLKVAYYVPTIPDVYSTSRYQHALALIEHFEGVHLISNNSIPETLSNNATSTVVLSESSVPALGRKAAAEARRRVGGDVLLTSPHYETGIAGVMSLIRGSSSPTWITDMYDPPVQYRLNNPRSIYQIASRGLGGLMKFASHGIHSLHPDTPYQYGRSRSFITNGAPVSRVEPSFSRSSPIHLVWVGSPRLDRGGDLLFEALHQTSIPLKLDIYGKKHDDVLDRIDDIVSNHEITHHGWADHKVCLQSTAAADIAFAVLPPREDWLYAHPIKVGEALAGGTIPLVSDFPGNQQLAGEAGEYVNPSANEIASAIDRLAALSDSEYAEKSKAARKRGEEVSWAKIRKQFTEDIIESQSHR